MSPISLLRVALTVQVLLGVVRFVSLYLGVRIPEPVWLVHPVLGVGVAVAAVWLLRDGQGFPASARRTAARFAVLAPLALGLARLTGVAGGLPLVLAHMVAGLAAIKLLDTALVQEDARRPRPIPAVR